MRKFYLTAFMLIFSYFIYTPFTTAHAASMCYSKINTGTEVYYLNKSCHLTKSEHRNNGRVTQISTYLPNTKFSDRRDSKLYEFDLNNDLTIKYAYKLNNGKRVLRYTYKPGTKYGNHAKNIVKVEKYTAPKPKHDLLVLNSKKQEVCISITDTSASSNWSRNYVNSLRKTNKLSLDTKLEAVAKTRALEEAKQYAQQKTIDHTSPSNAIKGLGENIAYTSSSNYDAHMHDLWKNSPGHYKNMANVPYKKYGYATAKTDLFCDGTSEINIGIQNFSY